MYIVGCCGLLKVSGTTPFVYQLLMTLLVMMLQLALVMRPQLAMMLVIVVGPWVLVRSMWSAAVGEVKELPHSERLEGKFHTLLHVSLSPHHPLIRFTHCTPYTSYI